MSFKAFQGNQTIILKKYTAGRKRKKATLTNLGRKGMSSQLISGFQGR